MNPVVALTVAGSDSGAGAGLQADLKTFSALGVFGACVVTAVTAQSTAAVLGVHALDPSFVELQLEAVTGDLAVSATKTGMLATSQTVAAVGRWAARGLLPDLVVDPVLVASTGRPLLDEAAPRAYLEHLLPFARLVTPNMREAELLSGIAVTDHTTMVEAARRLVGLGAAAVLVKGGHLAGGDASDVLVTHETCEVIPGARVRTVNDHGTGCTLSAAIAARLARGDTLSSAVREAKCYVTEALLGSSSWSLGKGHGPLDHFGWGTSR